MNEEQTIQKPQTLPEGWQHVTEVNGPLLTRIVASYIGVVADSVGLYGFLEALNKSILFVHPLGWMALDNVRSGLSCQFHGAKWNNTPGSARPPLAAMLDFLLTDGGFKIINAAVPEHCVAGIKAVEALGFVKTGALLAADTYDGEPRNVLFFSKIKE